MTLDQFIDRVTEMGMCAAYASYSNKQSSNAWAMLQGSIAGFKACKGQTPEQISKLLKEANEELLGLYSKDNLSQYWEKVCYRAEIEYVLKSVSCYYMLIGEDGAYGNVCRQAYPATALTMLNSIDIFEDRV